MDGFVIYNKMMSAYIEKLQNADTSSEDGYIAIVDECNRELLEFISKVRKTDPLMIPITFANENYLDKVQETEFIQNISNRAKMRRTLDFVYSGKYKKVEIQENTWKIPVYINFNKTPNFKICPKENGYCSYRKIGKTLNPIILACYMSLPVGSLKVHFIDPTDSGLANDISQIVPSALYKVYKKQEEIYALWDLLSEQIKSESQSGNDRFINHIVVILESGYLPHSKMSGTQFLRECGPQCGVYFIDVSHNSSFYNSRTDVPVDKSHIGNSESSGDNDRVLIEPYNVFNSPRLLLACTKYLNACSDEALEQLQKFQIRLDELCKQAGERAKMLEQDYIQTTNMHNAPNRILQQMDNMAISSTIENDDQVLNTLHHITGANDIHNVETMTKPNTDESPLEKATKRLKELGFEKLRTVKIYREANKFEKNDLPKNHKIYIEEESTIFYKTNGNKTDYCICDRFGSDFSFEKFKDGYIWEFSQGYSSGYKIHVNAWYKDYCLGNIYFYFPNFGD